MTHTKKISTIGIVLALVALAVGYTFISYGPDNGNGSQVAGTQIPEDYELMKDEPAAPDINNEEFILVGSNINCSEMTVNGESSRSCSGSIRVVPSNNQGYESGLYRINEETSLSVNGSDADLDELQALAKQNAKIRLTLTENSESMIKEIKA